MSWEDTLKADKEQTFLNKVKEVASKTNYNIMKILTYIISGPKVARLLPTYAEKIIEDARLKEEYDALSPEEKEKIKQRKSWKNVNPFPAGDWSFVGDEF